MTKKILLFCLAVVGLVSCESFHISTYSKNKAVATVRSLEYFQWWTYEDSLINKTTILEFDTMLIRDFLDEKKIAFTTSDSFFQMEYEGLEVNVKKYSFSGRYVPDGFWFYSSGSIDTIFNLEPYMYSIRTSEGWNHMFKIQTILQETAGDYLHWKYRFVLKEASKN